ncbi:MAG: xanthine dehydrogenase family protein molybdopterin-binding subunit [Verrucomicrobiales bacterium]|nr:xanthine dehydrogenase family protein molybdopterin-binding subunit [Verrucomicrobiales bacterium]
MSISDTLADIHQPDAAKPNASSPGWDRRGFLVTVANGLALGFFLPGGGRQLLAADPVATETSINTYVRIGSDGKITLRFGGCEMGQGSMSGLVQILAEELQVDWNQIGIEQADADATISYVTGGSSAVRRRYLPLRTAGATARELLVAAAMLRNGDQDRTHYFAKSAKVTYRHPVTLITSTWPYGDLAVEAASPQAQALLPATIPLTAPTDFRLIGKRLPRPDIPLKTNGEAEYGIDVFLPGMVFAVIKHCQNTGGTLAAVPSTPSGALALVPCFAYETRGSVVKGDLNAVAIVADNTWKAWNIAKRLKPQWKLPASTASVDSASLAVQAKDLLASGTPVVAEQFSPTGDVTLIEQKFAAAIGGASRVIDATFQLPYVAHATMEVLNCSVLLTYQGNDPIRCEVWAPNQAAMSVQATAAALTRLKPEQVVVHTTFLGGGLGRKIEQDYVAQAIQVALVVRKPVKLTWMREEDFGHDQYRPMAVIRGRAGLDAEKNIVAWSYRNVSPSILGQRGRGGPGFLDTQATEGSTKLPYVRGTGWVDWVPLPAGIPVGFWRSVGSSINSFAVEVMIDMLASEAGMDPFAFRYKVLADDRARAVLTAVDALSGWRKTLASGHAWGLAMAESFGTMVAEVVDISQPTSTTLRVHRVACVVDCGTVINPDSVEAQMEGGIIHGLNAALWGRTTFAQGVATPTNFNRARMLRLNDAPDITVQVLPSQAAPSGVGEPGVPPAAPAVANALSRLTGRRVTSLPLLTA